MKNIYNQSYEGNANRRTVKISAFYAKPIKKIWQCKLKRSPNLPYTMIQVQFVIHVHLLGVAIHFHFKKLQHFSIV
jgi:hypothetical protein